MRYFTTLVTSTKVPNALECSCRRISPSQAVSSNKSNGFQPDGAARTTNSDARQRKHVRRVKLTSENSICAFQKTPISRYILWTRACGYSLGAASVVGSTVRKLIGSAGREPHANPALLLRSVSGVAPKIPGLYAKATRVADDRRCRMSPMDSPEETFAAAFPTFRKVDRK